MRDRLTRVKFTPPPSPHPLAPLLSFCLRCCAASTPPNPGPAARPLAAPLRPGDQFWITVVAPTVGPASRSHRGTVVLIPRTGSAAPGRARPGQVGPRGQRAEFRSEVSSGGGAVRGATRCHAVHGVLDLDTGPGLWLFRVAWPRQYPRPACGPPRRLGLSPATGPPHRVAYPVSRVTESGAWSARVGPGRLDEWWFPLIFDTLTVLS